MSDMETIRRDAEMPRVVKPEYGWKEFRDELSGHIESGRSRFADRDGTIWLWTDRGDTFSDETVVGFFRGNAGTPSERMAEVLDEYAVSEDTSFYFQGIAEEMSDAAWEFYSREREDAEDVFRMLTGPAYRPEDWDREVNVNIFLDPGDGSAADVLLSLAESQGKREELEKALESGDAGLYGEFVYSAAEELDNAAGSWNAVVFCTKMKLSELLKIAESDGDLSISADTPCGLMDPWTGGGSLLEVSLEKPVRVPRERVFSIAPDGFYRWDVGTTYGMCGSFWKGRVSLETPA